MTATFNVLDYAAAGDGQTNDAEAIQKALDACAAAGGGTVLLPAGRSFLSGSIRIHSFTELHVERGAALIASDREADYPHRVFDTGPEADKRIWIQAVDAEHIALTGGGVIDGRCMSFVTETRPDGGFNTHRWRPAMTCFAGCCAVQVRELTLRDAANWALHFVGCEDVLVHGVTIRNRRDFPNCDGIDPDHCRNVRISDCHIEAGDDCIVLKNTDSFRRYGPTENITITGCTLMSTSCAIKIGSESVDAFRDIVVTGCIIKDSNRGIGLQLRDEGMIEHVLFSDMIIQTRLFGRGWWGAGEPIYITALPRHADSTVGPLRHVRFRNIACRAENGIYLHGCAQSRPDRILFDNVSLQIDKTTEHPGGRHDPRPCDMAVTGGGRPIGKPTPWGQCVEATNPGVFLHSAQKVTMRHFDVEWGENRPDYYTHALEAHGVEDLVLDNFHGTAADPGRYEATMIE